MKLNLFVLTVIVGSITSCSADVRNAGGEIPDALAQGAVPDAAPDLDDGLLTNEGAGVGEKIWVDEMVEPIILAQAQSAEVTIGNEGEEAIRAPQGESEGNLFIDSKENEMDEETAKKAEASFEWVSPKPNSGEDLAEGAGFEWSEDGSEEASGKAEANRSAAEARADEEKKARDEAANTLEQERLRSQEAISEAQRKADEELTAATKQMQAELQALKDEQARILAEIETSNKAAKEQAARDEKVRQAELDGLRQEAEKERMASEAARREVDEIAKEKAAAEQELKRAQLETERVQADAEQARLRAESDAKAKAQVEAELLKAKEDKTSAERVAKKSATKEAIASIPVPEKPKARVIRPEGTLQLAKLVQGALVDGVYGIQLGGEARIENLNGAKIELAAYFYDGAGEPLKDNDKVNRSSRGQVYVGKELVAESNAYTLKDGLFLPFEQLDLGTTETSDVQVELVLWEYSQGRGRRLAVAQRETFTYAPISSSERENIKRREDISGAWKQGDMTITVDQQGEKVVVTGLDVVPNTIVSEEWRFVDGKLLGSVVSQRKFPKRVRVWDFELKVSQDGKSLTGKYHRADKKGNFAFDSESFVWKRMP